MHPILEGRELKRHGQSLPPRPGRAKDYLFLSAGLRGRGATRRHLVFLSLSLSLPLLSATNLERCRSSTRCSAASFKDLQTGTLEAFTRAGYQAEAELLWQSHSCTMRPRLKLFLLLSQRFVQLPGGWGEEEQLKLTNCLTRTMQSAVNRSMVHAIFVKSAATNASS